MCALFSKGPDPFWAGFGGQQQGFFCCEVPEEELYQPVANAALIILENGSLSEEQLEEELKDLVDETWTWQVCKINESDFSVVFPSKESLRMAIRGGGITLPACKIKAIVTVPTGDPTASERLQETWVRLHGVPPPLRHADRLLMSTREIGRPIGVDADSLSHPSNPIRMSFGFRDPALMPSSVTIFVNMEGFKIQVVPEVALADSSPPHAPPPSLSKDRDEDKDEDLEETDEDRWDGRRGHHPHKERLSSLSAPAGNKSGPAY
jgi:hypothetical protein